VKESWSFGEEEGREWELFTFFGEDEERDADVADGFFDSDLVCDKEERGEAEEEERGREEGGEGREEGPSLWRRGEFVCAVDLADIMRKMEKKILEKLRKEISHSFSLLPSWSFVLTWRGQ